MNEFVICIHDKDYNEDWIKVKTDNDLSEMSEEKLIKVLSGHIDISVGDRIFVGSLNVMEEVSIN